MSKKELTIYFLALKFCEAVNTDYLKTSHLYLHIASVLAEALLVLT